MIIHLVYPGKITLQHLPPGCTTVYDAALSLTGRDPGLAEIGFGGDHSPTWPQLLNWIATNRESYDLFIVFLTCLRDGALKPKLPVYVEATGELDPFLTLIAEADARALLASRRRIAETGADSTVLYAFEAISWLATGRAVAYSGRHDLFHCRQSTWGRQWFESWPRGREHGEMANAFDARACDGIQRREAPPPIVFRNDLGRVGQRPSMTGIRYPIRSVESLSKLIPTALKADS